MLKVTYHTSSRGTLERKVRSKIDQIAALWDELDDFERLYNTQIEQISKLNHINANHAFRLKASGTNALVVWHYTPEGDPDRMIATIHYKPKQMKTYNILDLSKMTMPELIDVANQVGLTVISGTNKQNLIYQILDRQEQINTDKK